jgi:hypothetical protein
MVMGISGFGKQDNNDGVCDRFQEAQSPIPAFVVPRCEQLQISDIWSAQPLFSALDA